MPGLEHTMIGHYSIEDYLTRGGMSEIYLARDTNTQRLVAMKLVHNSKSDYYTRFRYETAMVASLTHDHILPVFDYGESGPWCYLVTPYISDGTLHQRLIQSPVPLPLRDAGMILEQLADALQYAHDCGIVHRDIKPSNILLRDGVHVYLADFGLAQRIDKAPRAEEGDMSQDSYLMGTPEYMAPELAESDPTPASDIYSLGVLLYQMLTGRVPFSGSTPIGTYLKHLRERPMAPSTLNPSIPDEIEAVVMRAVQRKPGRRFPSARTFADAYWEAMREVARQTPQISRLPARLATPNLLPQSAATLEAMPTRPPGIGRGTKYVTMSAIHGASLRKTPGQRKITNRSRHRGVVKYLQTAALVAVTAASLVFFPLVLGYAMGTPHPGLTNIHMNSMQVNLLPDALSPPLSPPITTSTPHAVNGATMMFALGDGEKHEHKHKHKHKHHDNEEED